ncbi:MAG: alpha/beta fold hydrolase [Candidatus Nanopelagicales bacterium]|nr:alpha/beta fold hydrolase [Candidatus Nanopelagicales bacterium]
MGTGDQTTFWDTGAERVAGAVSGAGPRLVLIHGLGQDHRIWAEIQRALPEYHCFAYDIRGHGTSPLGAGAGTLAQLGQDLVEFLTAVGPATCVGLSLGGVIALWAAAERPDLVSGVIAVATSSVVGKTAAAAMVERIEVFKTAPDERIYELMYNDTTAQLAKPGNNVSTITAARIEAIGDRGGYLNGARAVCSMRDESINDRLPAISAPVLIINGENDLWCPRRAAEIMLEQLRDAEFVELPGVGHLITDEDPSGLVSTMRNWLQSER